jgi:hypothetical protein
VREPAIAILKYYNFKWVFHIVFYKNLQEIGFLDIGYAPEIKEICRLDNKIYTGSDFFDQ